MENSKLPFRIWFIAMHVMTSTKKNTSALELQRQLGLKYYEPVWCMMHKIRRAMANRDDKHKAKEVPEVIVAKIKSQSEPHEQKKKGKSRTRETDILVTAETVQLSTKTGKKKSLHCGHFKIQVIESKKKKTSFDKRNRKAPVEIVSKEKPRKRDSIKFVKCYQVERPTRRQIKEVPAWITTILGNAQTTIMGIYHGVSSRYLQNYLSEFCYKMNRRNLGINVFNRLLIASTSGWNQ